MRILNSRKGFSLVEGLIAVTIMTLIGAGVMTMMISTVSGYGNTSAEAFRDTDAVMAMQMIVNDVREAKSINIIANGDRLRVIFPVRTAQGYYDRHQADMANQIDYYVSDETGVPGHSGTWLWRGKNNNNRTPLKKDIVSVYFEQDTSRSVKITVTAQNATADGTKQTQLTQRVVYLRNY